MADPLARYKAKRNFSRTPEPAAGGSAAGIFVVQEHHARRLHYDFRLELDGTLKSWAIPKGPSLDPAVKRMAVQVEDHPVAYAQFEGRIPAPEYGAGEVLVWDQGLWTPVGDARAGLAKGELRFTLDGRKLGGAWVLVRLKDGKNWLLIKEKDAYARAGSDFDVARDRPGSVLTPVLPRHLAPQLATLVTQPPRDSEDWLFEVKFDGYRLLARLAAGEVRLFTRQGLDWTARLPRLADELRQQKLPDAWLDGEIVLPGADGRPDFAGLQQAIEGDTADLVYYLFDLPFAHGQDLRHLPLARRRALLSELLADRASPHLRLSEAIAAPAAEIVAAACALGLEGVVGKRRDAPYVAGRSPHWIKLKCGQRQEFLIVGYTAASAQPDGLSALMLGYHADDGQLRFAGHVGTGFDQAARRDLLERLRPLEQAGPAVPLPTARARRRRGVTLHWVRPQLVCEVSFANWTAGGALRHASFRGLRTDKPASAIGRERAQPVEEAMHLTHGERVIDARSGCTKQQLAAYVDAAADRMLPWLQDRPVALLRAPGGIGAERFFQKHAEPGSLDGARLLPTALDPGHPPMLVLDTRAALLAAVQWNVVEIHAQNACGARYAQPDRMVFDLDPGEGVAWPQMQEAARVVHGFLDELGLTAFLKTSGGKGLHLVVPLVPRWGWDAVKATSQAVVQQLAKVLPQHFAAKSGPRNRVGRIFVDYLRNGRGATTVTAWSPRARPGMGISVPLAWDELDAVGAGDHWHILNVFARLEVGNTPWDGYADAAGRLDKARRRLGLD
ncbi:DNA ligase D [Massilia sp. TS11]|uniref:DNA ligase D n=1 Tax=Massilia sp. TS11 TaxID=2908003 RepID=UPI001EDAEBF8|nr:DNA ligase D [Massilia sp. TS11]MCG2584473.1 DNA ligase D [Massilia sp. TS11]